MFRIEYTKGARKDLGRLDQAIKDRIGAAIDALGLEPHPPGSRKMVGSEALYRVRVGNYRVIYEIQNKILTVFIIKIGHRKDIYR